ncbi:MAG: hypothetical protein IJA35_01880 [Clostridia bacterium]|nr:hypothetical protein [Clostridia bacterium]
MPKYYYRDPKKGQKKRPQIVLIAIAIAAIVVAALALLLTGNDEEPAGESSSPSPSTTLAPSSTEFEPAPTSSPEITVYPQEPKQTSSGTQIETIRPAQPSVFYNTLYEANIRIDERPESYLISCDLLLRYKNRTQTEQYALYLKLIPNFYEKDSVGINELSVNGMQAYFSLNESRTTLMIPFTSELLPDEGISVYVSFTVNISKTDSPFINAGELDLSYILPMVAKTNSIGEWNTANTNLVNYRMTYKVDGNVLIHCPEGMVVSGANLAQEHGFLLSFKGVNSFEIKIEA